MERNSTDKEVKKMKLKRKCCFGSMPGFALIARVLRDSVNGNQHRIISIM